MSEQERPARLPRPPRRPGAEGTVSFLVTFGAAVAATVAFAWASQSAQDDAIRRNETSIAVLRTRLEAICEKLDEIRGLLSEPAASVRAARGRVSEDSAERAE